MLERNTDAEEVAVDCGGARTDSLGVVRGVRNHEFVVCRMSAFLRSIESDHVVSDFWRSLAQSTGQHNARIAQWENEFVEVAPYVVPESIRNRRRSVPVVRVAHRCRV